MPPWLQTLLSEIEPIAGKAESAIKFGEGVATEVASSDSIAEKITHIGGALVDFATEIETAIAAKPATGAAGGAAA